MRQFKTSCDVAALGFAALAVWYYLRAAGVIPEAASDTAPAVGPVDPGAFLWGRNEPSLQAVDASGDLNAKAAIWGGLALLFSALGNVVSDLPA